MDVIFLIDDQQHLVRMTESEYENEQLLQELLAKYPDVLAGHTTSGDHRWLLVDREVKLPDQPGGYGRWSLDHLFVDEACVPTLVEVKRRSDTRGRREVAGQMLDYAANLVAYLPASDMRSLFERRCSDAGIDPDEQLAVHIGGTLDADGFWREVQVKLEERRLRLVFVSDEISTELQAIIEFLNPQLNRTTLLAIEVKQYIGPGGRPRTLVPRVIGQTAASEELKGIRSPARPWDEESFAQAVRIAAPSRAAVFEDLLGWSHDMGAAIGYGRGPTYGTARPRLTLSTGELFTPFSLSTNGRIEIIFSAYPPPLDTPETRLEFIRRVNETAGTAIPERAAHTHTFFDAAPLESALNIEAFMIAFADVVDRVRTVASERASAGS
jgi:hypothetical protein